MKLSDLTAADVCEYLRIDEEENDPLLHGITDAARDYILSYTGLTQDQADGHDDLVMAFLLLCQDMYDHRSAGQEDKSVNRTLDTILGMHTRSLV